VQEEEAEEIRWMKEMMKMTKWLLLNWNRLVVEIKWMKEMMKISCYVYGKTGKFKKLEVFWFFSFFELSPQFHAYSHS